MIFSGKIKKGIITFSVTLLIIQNVSYATVPFTDVKEGAWYYDVVEELVNANIVNGYTDGTFKPDVKVTKAQVIKLLVMTVFSNFVPFNGSGYWAEPYVKEAVFLNILEKEMTKEECEQEITREEAIYYMSKALNSCKDINQVLKDSTYKKEDEEKILDYNTITEKYKKDVVVMYSRDFVKGYEDGTIKPKATLTRAEMCALISRIKAAREEDMENGYIDTSRFW